MTYQLAEMIRVEDVVKTEFAVSFALALTPGNTQHNRAFIIGMNKPDSYNFFLHYMDIAQQNGVNVDAVLLCDLNAMLYSKDGLYSLMTAFWEHPDIDILTPTWGEPHADIAQVKGGNTGFILIRAPALAKLMGQPYMIPVADVAVPRIFTDKDKDFGVLCAEAGLKWLEHGGVSCDYFHRAFRKAGVAIPKRRRNGKQPG